MKVCFHTAIKEKDVQDGRITRVYITEEGRRLKRETEKDWNEGYPYRLLSAIDSLSQDDYKKFMDLTMTIAKKVLDEEFLQYLEGAINSKTV